MVQTQTHLTLTGGHSRAELHFEDRGSSILGCSVECDITFNEDWVATGYAYFGNDHICVEIVNGEFQSALYPDVSFCICANEQEVIVCRREWREIAAVKW